MFPYQERYHLSVEFRSHQRLLFDLSRSAFLSVEDGSKSGHGRRGCLEEGAWDAIHVIQVRLLTLSIHTSSCVSLCHNCNPKQLFNYFIFSF